MQEIAEKNRTKPHLGVEIRSRDLHAAHPRARFLPDGVKIQESSRLLKLSGGDCVPAPDQLASLFDEHREWADETNETVDSQANILDIFCHPGVTDAEGDMAVRALSLMGASVTHCDAGIRFRFGGIVDPELRSAVEMALGNPLVHRFTWFGPGASQSLELSSEGDDSIEPLVGEVNSIPLAGMNLPDLTAVSEDLALALTVEEMVAVQQHFAELGRAPTDVELQSIALAWSEHCSHKTFKATIQTRSAADESNGVETIDGLLSTFIIKPSLGLEKSWVRSAFTDNAGVIALDDEYDIAIKVETHNHPTALEPYGGAHTGVGGVIRDVLAVSADPIANTDVLCFGPLDLPQSAVRHGANHPSLTFHEVVRGIGDYGNCMGIPTVGGAVIFNEGYSANPLVFCGTVGMVPRDSHPTEALPGDLIVVLGGRTGRDGLHGATMSSEVLDRQTITSSAVQIGAPIVEKVVRDVIPLMRDERLYHAITDCGAGGLCSAVGEMGSEIGFDCQLDLVRLKYQGLSPWEIWLSEAQERIVLAVPPKAIDRVEAICSQFEVDATVIGRFTDQRSMRLFYSNRLVADLPLTLLYNDCPKRVLDAVIAIPRQGHTSEIEHTTGGQENELLRRLLAHPNIASKESVIRRFDFEVGGGTVVKPLTANAGPSDAAVIRPRPESDVGVAISHGINPLYGRLDSGAMARLAVDEALRNLVSVGGSIDRAVLLDNFSWGEVDDPDSLGTLVRAAQGCRDAVHHFEVPFVCGKDSLRNTSTSLDGTVSIPGTLLITAVGVIEDIRRCITMDLKSPGNFLYLLGETLDELGGSHLNEVLSRSGGKVPDLQPLTPAIMRALTIATKQGLVASCHDVSEGGLAVAASEMAIAGQIGLDIDLDQLPTGATSPLLSSEVRLFSESSGRFLAEVTPSSAVAFEDVLSGLPCRRVGGTTAAPEVVMHSNQNTVIQASLDELERSWREPLYPIASEQLPQLTRSRAVGKAEFPTANVTRTRGSIQKTVTALILTAPGINCDPETAHACRLAGACPELVHVNDLTNRARSLDEFSALIIPGGFSYGDHLGAGALLATILASHLRQEIIEFSAQGKPIVGICNGFQVLARLGLLGPVSVAPNKQRQFECCWVKLQTSPSLCPFFEGMSEFDLPIAHGEGRVMVDAQYVSEVLTRAPIRYLTNPNGSVASIAGVCSSAGNVLGLMPHPERFVSQYQHSAWTSLTNEHRPTEAGVVFFENIVHAAARL